MTRHVYYSLCVFGRPCRDGATTLGEAYVRSVLHTKIPGTSVAPHVGPQLGLLFGDFQDGSVGVDIGGAGGLTVPVASSLQIDLGVIASMVYVGAPPAQASRGAWDWRLTLSISVDRPPNGPVHQLRHDHFVPVSPRVERPPNLTDLPGSAAGIPQLRGIRISTPNTNSNCPSACSIGP